MGIPAPAPESGALQCGRGRGATYHVLDWSILGKAKRKGTMEDIAGAERVRDVDFKGWESARFAALVHPQDPLAPEGDAEP